MTIRFRGYRVAVVLTLLLGGCGGGSQAPLTPTVSQPESVPTPAATPVPAPTPTSTPQPNPSVWPNGQTAVVRLTIKVQWVEDQNRKLRPYEEGAPIYAGEYIRFDATAKDVDNRPTEGSGDEPRWSWEPDEVAMLNDTHGFNPRGRALSPGKFHVTAYLDAVDSNELVLNVQ